MKPDFSLVVLCYKGNRDIIPFVEKLHATMSLCSFPWEMVLVGNYVEGKQDSTPEVVRELAKKLPNVRALTLPKRGMMGWDMRSGLDAAQGEYIGVIDGDGQFPAETVLYCYIKARLENIDLVKTYRVSRDDGFYRRLVSDVYNFLFRILFSFSVKDANSKPKIIRRSKYELMNLKADDWFIDAEIMIRAKELNLSIQDIPSHFYILENRNSFVKPAAIFEFIFNLFRYRFRRKL